MRIIHGEKDADGKYQAQVPIGSPMVMRDRRSGAEIYCRITRVEGGILHAVTPHGSTLYGGAFWFRPIETDAERAKLAEFDADALAKNGKVEGLMEDAS